MTINIIDYLSRTGTTFNDLIIFSKLWPHEVPRVLEVTDRTVRRWKQTGDYPPWAMKLMAVRAGYLIQPGWTGYRIAMDGRLYKDGYRDGLEPGMVSSLWHISRNLHHFRAVK